MNFPADASLVGRIIDVEITAALTHTLRGRVVESPEPCG